MDDKELLQLAASAAGIDAMWRPNVHEGGEWLAFPVDGGWLEWNPLTDDADAFRLAVKLNLYVRYHHALAQALVTTTGGDEYQVNVEDCGHNACKATRRAITRAAAAIGTTHD